MRKKFITGNVSRKLSYTCVLNFVVFASLLLSSGGIAAPVTAHASVDSPCISESAVSAEDVTVNNKLLQSSLLGVSIKSSVIPTFTEKDGKTYETYKGTTIDATGVEQYCKVCDLPSNWISTSEDDTEYKTYVRIELPTVGKAKPIVVYKLGDTYYSYFSVDDPYFHIDNFLYTGNFFDGEMSVADVKSLFNYIRACSYSDAKLKSLVTSKITSDFGSILSKSDISKYVDVIMNAGKRVPSLGNNDHSGLVGLADFLRYFVTLGTAKERLAEIRAVGLPAPIPSNVTVGGWANDADCWTTYHQVRQKAKNYSDKTVYYYIKTEGKAMTLYIYGCGEVGSFWKFPPQYSCANFAEDAPFEGAWGDYTEKITKVVLGNNITGIQTQTFINMDSLKTIKLGRKVTYIGDGAFAGCDALTSVKVPGTVKTIECDAFRNCSSLKYINVCEGVESVGGAALETDNENLTIVLPKSVTYTEQIVCNRLLYRGNKKQLTALYTSSKKIVGYKYTFNDWYMCNKITYNYTK
jgi:hypothetical protein